MAWVAFRKKRPGSLSLVLLNFFGNAVCIYGVILLEQYSNVWLPIMTNIIIQGIPAFGKYNNGTGKPASPEVPDFPERKVRFRRRLAPIALGAVCWHVLAVLYGAYVLTEVMTTLQFAILMSILTVMPFVVFHGMYLDFHPMRVMFSHPGTSQDVAILMQIGCWACAGAWVSSAALVLDWDRPWQVWPFPCTIGAIAGQLIGWTFNLVAHKSSKSAKVV